MTSTKLLLIEGPHTFARPLRDYAQSRGYQTVHAEDYAAMCKLAERRRVDCLVVDYKLLYELHNGSLPQLPGKGFKVVMVPHAQLISMHPYLQAGVINDYLLTPVNKGEISCLLDKVEHFNRQQTQFDKTSLEDLVEHKLISVLQQLDLGSLHDLHNMIMPRLERPLIKMVLNKTQGNQLKAAAVLGINRNTLRNKLKTLHIDPDKL